MQEFAIGGFVFLGAAIVGLLSFVLGIIFLVKNIKRKEEKDRRGENSLSNVIGIICFSMMTFMGGMWVICFGIAAVVFFIMSAV